MSSFPKREEVRVKEAYDGWADQYDANDNKTRDLEAVSLRETLGGERFDACLEIGCGTGKNTEWLVSKADRVVGVDLSEGMLARAKMKISSDNVEFVQADISREWSFAGNRKFDLVVFSLVLEHLENLDEIFEKAKCVLTQGGYVYIGELHPFKQYSGTKARFENENGLQVVTCFNHHISDFTAAAMKSGLGIVEVHEFFDDDDRANIPRILTLLLKNIP